MQQKNKTLEEGRILMTVYCKPVSLSQRQVNWDRGKLCGLAEDTP